MLILALILGGGALLYFGAQWLVKGSSALAQALGVPQLIVGLTVVAYGTSTPEVIVSVQAALAGHPDVALGNVVGSNIVNIGLILGVSVLIAPARVDGALRKRELPILVISALAVPLLLLDGRISRLDGALLLAGGVAYTAWVIRGARTAAAQARAPSGAAVEAPVAQEAGHGGALRSGLTALLGLIVLVVGGRLFVDGSVGAARALGLSERLVGLTIVAIGTSLPELITSFVAARRGYSDLAIGNVVGSNIFNVLFCLGGASLLEDIDVPMSSMRVDMLSLLLMTFLAAILIRRERVIPKAEGGLTVGLYAVYLVVTIARG